MTRIIDLDDDADTTTVLASAARVLDLGINTDDKKEAAGMTGREVGKQRRRSPTANYANVNGAWPDTVPVPTPQEALAGARRLVRLALKLGPPNVVPWRTKFGGKFELTSGNRFTWTRRGVFYVNPDKPEWGVGRGWQTMCHDIAHWAHRRLYGGKPHTAQHAFIERKLAEYVVSNGWLDGKLKRPEKPTPKPSTIDKQRDRLAATEASIKRWLTKERRAKTALRKLAIRKRYYERTLAT